MVGALVWRCRCATSWSDLDLTFDLTILILTYKILSGLYLGNHEVKEVGGCRCATSWCDLDLTFDLAVAGLYLGNRKVLEVDTW